MRIVEIMPERQHTMRAVPIGAFETAPDVGTNTLGRCRAAVGRWKCVAWLKAGPTPFHQSPGRVDTKDFSGYYTLLIMFMPRFDFRTRTVIFV